MDNLFHEFQVPFAGRLRCWVKHERLDRVCAANRLYACLGKSEVLDLTGLDQRCYERNRYRYHKTFKIRPQVWSICVVSKSQFACSLFICLAAIASAQAQSGTPATEDIVARMAQAQAGNRTHTRPYVVTRDYKLFDRESHLGFESRVVAAITVVPPDSKQYIIESTHGSEWGEKIVRKMLDGEVAFAKDSGSTDITPANYDFQLIREDEWQGLHCYVLELLPRRKSKDLLHGSLWVNATTYLPQRVEGEPAKNLSWWLRDVRIVLLYGYLGPMWLQTSSEATASVRILGRSTLVWQDVRYQMDELIPGNSFVQTMVPVGDITSGEQP